MLKKTSYDQIYDEHIFMFSATSIKKVFNLFDFELIDVQKQITHGGSMRYVLSRNGEYSVSKNVKEGLAKEEKNKLHKLESCLIFKKNCEESKRKIYQKLTKYKADLPISSSLAFLFKAECVSVNLKTSLALFIAAPAIVLIGPADIAFTLIFL